MTTIVNSPTPTSDSGGTNFLLGIIIIVGLIVTLLYFGIPVIRRMGSVQLNIPAPQVVIPGKIDVNVQQSK